MDSTKSPELFKRPAWLTEDFIAEVLRKSEDDPDITVGGIENNFLVDKGDNYSSVVQRITVMYADGKSNQVEKPLIVKSAHEIPMMQQFLKEARLFDKEIHAYSTLLPAIATLTETPLITPKFYPTERDDAVILEDMASHGFKMADRKKRLDLSHSFLAVKALARFHGLSFAVVQKEPAVVDHFPESMFTERMREMNSRFLPKMYDSLARIVGTWPGFERFSDKLLSRADGLLIEMEEIVKPKKDAFNVLNHGDFWVNNLLFKYNKDTQIVDEICLLDLQVVRFGSPALDLQYFFATSLADGIRDEYEDALLEAYHDTLTDTLRSVNLESVKYTISDLKRDFQDKAFFGFNSGFIFLGAVVAEPSEAMDMENFTEETFDNMPTDLMEKTFAGQRSKDVIQRFLLFFEGKGVI